MFAEFIVPYLKQSIDACHDMGLLCIKHTDGNIMPILDQLVATGTDGLQSIDPQGGIDLKTVKEMYGNKICLMGNVNCGLLQTGTDEEVRQDVLRSLRDGMPGFGFIFSTSNVIYPGMPLERYELMHSIWKEHGVYK
jgi:uroporphyrinogen decarboxylase